MNPERKGLQSYIPIMGILNRYLITGYLRIFGLTLIAAALLSFIVEFFERIDNFLEAGAASQTILAYFLYRLPLFISRVFAVAALFSTLLSLGRLARNHEITALRASGISLHRISLPLILLSVVISVATFFWNEALVPMFATRSNQIYKTEVKKGKPKGLLGSRNVWMRGKSGFINADHFDPRTNTLEGVTIYLLDRDFDLTGVIEAKGALWNGNTWQAKNAVEWRFLEDGTVNNAGNRPSLPIDQTPEDFLVLSREAEEFSFFDLKRQIDDLTEIGVDTTEYQVDLHVKLAVTPLSTFMVLLAIPFALTGNFKGGLTLSFGVSTLLGFGYWFLLAFSISLGRSGSLPPWVSAWFATFVLAMVGIYFYTGQE
jgi:lipopolysaccharide export system permease protein